MARRYWLVKSEPGAYSWDDLVKDRSTYWEGVRNLQARNNLKGMKKGDLVLFYHSNVGKDVVGIARVTKPAYRDPSSDDERWVVVDVEPVKPMTEPVSLARIRAEPALRDVGLVRQSRLSVMPIEGPHFRHILKLGRTTVR